LQGRLERESPGERHRALSACNFRAAPQSTGTLIVAVVVVVVVVGTSPQRAIHSRRCRD
jgi:hypothetical protein